MKKWIPFILILLIAAFLRFYQLGVNPPSLDWDEAAWGYNAYSIGINGHDEFGRFLPHDYLESFGDFKPPVYAYIDVIPVKLFGLNAFATRFPSAFLGVITIAVTYFLTKRIFFRAKEKEAYALFASLFLAVSPWHIMLSRAAFEANVATFFIITGVWLFLAAMQEKKWLLPLSAISFVLSVYTFNTARVVAPLLVVVLGLFFLKKLWERKMVVLISMIVGVLLLLPTLHFLFSKQAGLRFQEVNIFSDVSVIKTINQEGANDHNAWWSKAIHNRRLVFSVLYVQHYLDNLSPSFLFISGDGNPKFSIQDVGQLYIWDLPFFVIGAFLLFRKKEGKWWIIPLWLLLGIVPAATARETPHALRIEATLPTFQILVAYGFWQAILFLRQKISYPVVKKLLIPVLLVVLLGNVAYFFHGLLTYYPYKYSGDWEYGYAQSISYVKTVQQNYDQIHVTQGLGRPYIYYLFYLQIPPATFRQTSLISRDVFGFVNVARVGKYYFDKSMPIEKNSRILYIAVPNEVPNNAKIQKNFYALNGDAVLVAYTL